MKRYDYVARTRLDNYSATALSEYMVFDRQGMGCTVPLAICDDRFNAEMIVTALNDARNK